MKRIILILSVLFSICSSSAKAESLLDKDGNYWKEMRFEKLYFLAGFITGSCFVAEDNIDSFTEGAPKLAETLRGQGWNEAVKIRNDRLKKYKIMDIKVGQLSQGLDKFYSDYRNQRIKIQQAVYVVAREIRGAPSEEITAITEMLRASPDGFFGGFHVDYIDKFGKKQSATFPF
jgi:hypothetical protein